MSDLQTIELDGWFSSQTGMVAQEVKICGKQCHEIICAFQCAESILDGIGKLEGPVQPFNNLFGRAVFL